LIFHLLLQVEGAAADLQTAHSEIAGLRHLAALSEQDLVEEIRNVQSRLASVETDRTAVRESLATAQKEIHLLGTKLQSSQETIEKQSIQLKQATSTVSQLQLELALVNAKNEESVGGLSTQLQQERLAARRNAEKADQLQSTLKDRLIDMDHCQTQLVNLKAQLADRLATLESTEHALAAAQSINTHAHAERAALEKELEIVNREVKAVSTDRAALDREYRSLLSLSANHEREIGLLKHESLAHRAGWDKAVRYAAALQLQMHRGLLAYAFKLLKANWLLARRHALLMRKTVRRLLSKTLARAFAALRDFWLRSRALRKRKAQVVRRWRKFGMSPAFARWQQFRVEMRALRGVAKKTIRRMLHRVLSRAFIRWAETARQQKTRRVSLLRCTLRWVSGRTAAAFDCWKLHIQTLRKSRILLSRAGSRILSRNLARAFSAWTAFAVLIKRQRRCALNVIGRMRHAQHSRAVASWLGFVRSARARKFRIQRALGHWSNRHVAAAFDAWRLHAAEQAQQRKVLRFSVQQWRSRIMAQAVRSWLAAARLAAKRRHEDSFQAQISHLSKHLAEQREAASAAVSQKVLLEHALHSQEETSTTLQEEIRMKAGHIDDLRRQLSDAKSAAKTELARTQEREHELVEDAKSSRREAAKAGSSLRVLTATYQAQSEEHAKLSEAYEELRHAVTTLRSRIDEEQIARIAAQARVTEQTAELHALVGRCSDESKRASSLREELEHAQHALHNTSLQISELQNELRETEMAKQALAALRKCSSEQSAELEHLHALRLEALTKQAELTAELHDQKTKAAVSLQQAADMQNELEYMRRELLQRSEDVDGKMSSLQKASERSIALADTIREKEAKIHQLERRFAELSEELRLAKVSLAEAILQSQSQAARKAELEAENEGKTIQLMELAARSHRQADRAASQYSDLLEKFQMEKAVLEQRVADLNLDVQHRKEELEALVKAKKGETEALESAELRCAAEAAAKQTVEDALHELEKVQAVQMALRRQLEEQISGLQTTQSELKHLLEASKAREAQLNATLVTERQARDKMHDDFEASAETLKTAKREAERSSQKLSERVLAAESQVSALEQKLIEAQGRSAEQAALAAKELSAATKLSADATVRAEKLEHSAAVAHQVSPGWLVVAAR
jgi:chromosome segregation ATPase